MKCRKFHVTCDKHPYNALARSIFKIQAIQEYLQKAETKLIVMVSNIFAKIVKLTKILMRDEFAGLIWQKKQCTMVTSYGKNIVFLTK